MRSDVLERATADEDLRDMVRRYKDQNRCRVRGTACFRRHAICYGEVDAVFYPTHMSFKVLVA